MTTAQSAASAGPRPGAEAGVSGPPRFVAVLAYAVVVGLVVVVPAAWFSGATASLALGDSGPVVRWGLPLVRVVHDVSAAATIGLLMLAAFLVPEARNTARRPAAARYAGCSAVIWFLAAVVGALLTFADSAGIPLSEPGFLAQFQTFVWDLDTLRSLAISSATIGLVACLAFVARTRGGLAWVFVLAVLALLPLALTGHSGGTEGHEAAVNSLAFHLVGVCVWTGGLISLVVMRPLLGQSTAVTVQRYSTIAGWAYVAVALSGVLNASIRVGTWSALAEPYGVLVIGKTLALVLLGLAGWQQRRAIVGRLTEHPASRAIFARLALLEIGIMAVAIGLATTLARTPTPVPEEPAGEADPVLALTDYPAPPPLEPASWFTVWRIDWLFATTAVLAVGLYLWGYLRLRRRGDHWPVGRLLLWSTGWLIFLYLTNGAPAVYGRVMFSAHMAMHMGLMMVIPMFLVLGTPITLALRSLRARTDRTLGPREVLLALVHSKYLNVVVNPVVAGVIFFGSLLAFYWTDLFELALITHTGHVLMVVHFLLSGYVFVWSLVGTDPGPRKWPGPLRLLVLFATLTSHAFFGVAMMQGTFLLAPGFFKSLDLAWVGDLIDDQQRGGAIAWGVGEFPTMVLALLVTLDWLRRDRAEERRSDRRADRTDDAELKAYNARLEALAERDRAGEQVTRRST